MRDLTQLPDNLPVPIDDGACDHLPGMPLPSLSLPTTSGEDVALASLNGRTVVYIYPMTGSSVERVPDHWDSIPGARGCTPQSCSFRDHYHELQTLNTQVFGLSTQATIHQTEARDRLHLPFELISDQQLALVNALSLPTFEVEGRVLIKRVTLIVNDGVIQHVFYPVFPPDKNVDQVMAYLQSQPS